MAEARVPVRGPDARGGHGKKRLRPKILLVYPVDATFVRTDLRLLRTFCEVTPFHYTGRSRYLDLAAQVARHDVVFMWFALGYAAAAGAVARALRKKVVLVSGGWDVSGMPEIGYGRLLTTRGVLTAIAALTLAHQVLAFSKWSERAIRATARHANVRTAYLGVNLSDFRPVKKERIVVTVANITAENLARKGLRDFVQASRYLPDVPFYLVGNQVDGSLRELMLSAGPNMQFPGRVSDGELGRLLARAHVYVQASYTEGFGLALAEAMASACVPVVTNVGAIPEVVGDTGFYVGYNNAAALAATIRKALDSDLGVAARRRAAILYREELRLEELRRTIRLLTSSGPLEATEDGPGAFLAS